MRTSLGRPSKALADDDLMTANNPSPSVQRLQQYNRIYAAHHQSMGDWLAIAPGSRLMPRGGDANRLALTPIFGVLLLTQKD